MRTLIRLVGQIGQIIVAAAAIGLLAPAHAAPVVFSGSGLDATNAFDSFNAAIGADPRRIGWDGVRLDGTDANPATRIIDHGKTVEIPVDRFRAAGAIFADPYSVSGDGFASVNPGTAGQFPAFSPNNTFVMFDQTNGQFNDRFIEQSFVLAGTDTLAGTRGFGAIFVDVERLGSSSIEYFGRGPKGEEVILGKFDVPIGQSGQPQFLGVLFDAPFITNVALTVGTNALFSFNGTTVASFGAENLARRIDLAVTDDFVFANPQAVQAVPEPETYAMLIAGLLAVASRVIKRRRGSPPS